MPSKAESEVPGASANVGDPLRVLQIQRHDHLMGLLVLIALGIVEEGDVGLRVLMEPVQLFGAALHVILAAERRREADGQDRNKMCSHGSSLDHRWQSC